MDRLSSRKLQLSEESGKVYEKANVLFDEWQNSVVFELAKCYLENGKIEPEKQVIEFLNGKGAKGFNTETNEPVEDIVMTEIPDEWLFPYSFEIDGTQTGCVLRIEKIKDPQPQQEIGVQMGPSPQLSLEKVEVDPILRARMAR